MGWERLDYLRAATPKLRNLADLDVDGHRDHIEARDRRIARHREFSRWPADYFLYFVCASCVAMQSNATDHPRPGPDPSPRGKSRPADRTRHHQRRFTSRTISVSGSACQPPRVVVAAAIGPASRSSRLG